MYETNETLWAAILAGGGVGLFAVDVWLAFRARHRWLFIVALVGCVPAVVLAAVLLANGFNSLDGNSEEGVASFIGPLVVTLVGLALFGLPLAAGVTIFGGLIAFFSRKHAHERAA